MAERTGPTTGTGEIILRASGVGRSFRGLRALSGYDLSLRTGEILGVIGPNGAGKTTLFNVITGFLPPTAGQITFRGQDITGWPAHRIAKLGIARTFQNIRLFTRMTVLDNVRAAVQLHHHAGMVATLLSLPSFTAREREVTERAMAYLDALGIADFCDADASSLPYGHQRKLEIARALAAEPAILLLDEPAAGMNEHETTELTEFIRELHQQFHLTLIVVEHDMSLIMHLCERIQVLNYGEVIAVGTPAEIRADPKVIEAYLGADDEPETVYADA